MPKIQIASACVILTPSIGMRASFRHFIYINLSMVDTISWMKIVVAKVDVYGFWHFYASIRYNYVIGLMCMGFNEWRKICHFFSNFYGVIRVHFRL